MRKLALLSALNAAAALTVLADPPEPKFSAQDIDKGVQIGYGLAIADVDGDGLKDILLADKKQFRWYKNPGKRDMEWTRYVMAENLTKNDNVCIAAQDIDGDGKCEVAVGAEWNPGDTVGSGAVFYLIPPADRTQTWEPVKFPSVEPTTHRMRWVQLGPKNWGLLVVPLHGRGNKNAEGDPVKVLVYLKPEDPKSEWQTEVVSEAFHATHNFELVRHGKEGRAHGVILGGKEGLRYYAPTDWKESVMVGKDGPVESPKGIGEVRVGKAGGDDFVAAVEPMHGNELVVYLPEESSHKLTRKVLTDKLIQGHALACGDVLGAGGDQIVVGWRGGQPGDKVGIAVWTSLDASGEKWRESLVDDGQTACEDLQLADLDEDGKLDIIAAGRATHNLRILWNRR